MNTLAASLAAAFFAGLLGSTHCLGMCAGISGMFTLNAAARGLRAQLPAALVYNAGRIASYAVLGAIAAVFGSTLLDIIPSIAGPLRLIGGALIVLIGLQIAFNWRVLQPLERMGGQLWAKVAPFAKGLLPVTSMPKAAALGLLWGLLPCGLVYSVLLMAATSADSARGAMIMLAFGLGTLPAMLATGLGAIQLNRILGRKGARLGAGLLVIIVGLLTLASPLRSMLATDAGHHQHMQQH